MWFWVLYLFAGCFVQWLIRWGALMFGGLDLIFVCNSVVMMYLTVCFCV